MPCALGRLGQGGQGGGGGRHDDLGAGVVDRRANLGHVLLRREAGKVGRGRRRKRGESRRVPLRGAVDRRSEGLRVGLSRRLVAVDLVAERRQSRTGRETGEIRLLRQTSEVGLPRETRDDVGPVLVDAGSTRLHADREDGVGGQPDLGHVLLRRVVLGLDQTIGDGQKEQEDQTADDPVGAEARRGRGRRGRRRPGGRGGGQPPEREVGRGNSDRDGHRQGGRGGGDDGHPAGRAEGGSRGREEMSSGAVHE